MSDQPVEEYVKYHKDGSVWAKGQMIAGQMSGYWEWYRLDGSKMRTGYFEANQQVGEWVTYDKAGNVIKITHMKQLEDTENNV